MAFSVGNQIRIADQSSEYRRRRGVVKRVLSGSAYDVRVEGHGCTSTVRFLEVQLKSDSVAPAVSYAQCSG